MTNRAWDIIIIGSGLAGLSAAIEVAKNGRSVVIVEKRDTVGGNSKISGGSLAIAGSFQQKKQNISDSSNQFTNDILNAGKINDKTLVEQLAKGSKEALQWLKTEVGVEFIEQLEKVEGHTIARIHTPKSASGADLINPALKRAKQLGVEIFTGCKASQILLSDDGKVSGVAVEWTGKECALYAQKAIILASGGFSSDARLKVGKKNVLLQTSCLPNTAKEGIDMAVAIGASTRDMDTYCFLPSTSNNTLDYKEDNIISSFVSFLALHRGVLINADTGKRFVNETVLREELTSAILKIGKPVISISSQNILEHASDELMRKIRQLDVRLIQKFNTLEKLVSRYEIPQKALQNTLSHYNEMLATGKDADYGKVLSQDLKAIKPPFITTCIFPKVHYTPGGLVINKKAQVLSDKGEIIPGLYAAGEVTSGIHGKSRLGGCALTDCVVFGRIAGRQASY
ncbi:MAG: flavocytochrome c [Balneola sp.]|nr:MAG: flavocytochrome c [Balneola sp.]